MMHEHPEPTGHCWYCGEPLRPGRFFCQTHDRKAEAAVIKTVYGGIPGLLLAHGYQPGGPNTFVAS
jgi:hypothetical protein